MMEKLTEESHPGFLPDSRAPSLESSEILLHETFEAQVDRTPDALAAAGEGERLTYRQLEDRANQLAAHLRAFGVRPEVRVGVCMERSTELLVALLATLKAGGAYVPLDPAYPPQRVSYMLDDSRAEVILTQRSVRSALPAPADRQTVLLDDHAAEIAACPTARLKRLSHVHNLAYFIYTSGSTGRPKGVAIEHHSVVSLLRWVAEVFSPQDLAGVLASTSICFDISIFEMFAPLSLGGTAIVAGGLLDVPYLPAEPPVTLISTVPSAMAELVRSARVPSCVRVCNLGGEALPGSLVEAIYRTTSVERVYNVYGPSEDTTYSTCALIPRGSRIAPPVGDPVTGTRIWLLDEEGAPVRFGEEGEVHLTGAGLARGYFGRPELTAERFLPDPFADEPGGRMYRVGDLGRLLPDGQLHYVGRIDFQVKIRGFRVELGEVEDALMRHPAVREAAVMARGEVVEGKHLVAYLAVDGSMPAVGELRSFLGKSLPHYMVPSRFVRLDALPRTLNGKVDRKALPDAPAGPGSLAAAPDVSGERLPLSFAQQRLWLADRLQPGAPTYNEPEVLDLLGFVDRAALAAALSEIVRRHETLRTRFLDSAATPFQEIALPAACELPLIDLAALPEERRGGALESGVRQEVRRPFDLARPPLLRVALFRREVGEHTLSLVVHHIAYDGRSKEILARELSALYAAACSGRPSPLPELQVSCGDLARREQESWRGIPPWRLAEWRRLLKDVSPLELPGDRPCPAERTWRGFTVRFEIPPGQVAPLRILARAESATLFKALLAVFAALLGRTADRLEGVLGTTAAGRTQPASRDLIGFFVNLLPLRVDLSGSPSLRSLLARVRARVDAAAAAQDEVHFGQLVAALQPARGAGGDAFFTVLFQLHPPLALPQLPGLEVRRRPVDTGTAKLDLETTLCERGGALEGFCQASSDLYDSPTIERFAGWFQSLLAAALADPDLPLDAVPLFSAAERRELEVGRQRLAGHGASPAVSAAAERAGESAMPASELVSLVAGVWAEELGLPGVGRKDNFFDLGGHSLLGTRVLVRLRDLVGVDLPLGALFRAPTVERLAGVLAERADGRRRPLPPSMFPLSVPTAVQADVPARLPAAEVPGDLVELVARTWSEVLEVPSVQPDDNFFHLGGHSLLGARVLARFRDGLGVDVPIRTLFTAPTPRAFASFLRAGMSGEARPLPPLTRRPVRDASPPLSFAQERFWFLSLMEGGSSAHNIPLAFTLEGPLDVPALAAALREIVRRHEILRTRFLEEDGELRQQIEPVSGPDLPYVDLRALPGEASQGELGRLGRAEAAEGFDLGRGPLMRTWLAGRGTAAHVLFVTFHHAGFDGESQAVFERELSVLYAAAAEGRPSPLRELPLNYASYALWQRSWLGEEILDELLAWWRRELAGAPTVLALPVDRPRPEVLSFRGAAERLELPGSLAEEVSALGQREGATRFMIALAALQALLGCLCGQEDLLVGTPAANRPSSDLESLIGVFVETLVLRGQLAGDPPFRELLARVRDTSVRAFSHQDLPFERLVAGLRVERSPSRNPLVQVLLSFREARAGLTLPGIAVRPFEGETDTSRRELTFFVEETASGLALKLEYAVDFFEPATARRLLSQFAALLTDCVGDPARRPLSEVPPLRQEERRQLLSTEIERIAPPERPQPPRETQQVARIWVEELGAPAVEPDDDFFQLGGHSLLGARMLARIRALYGVDLPIQELFRTPTVRGLAERIASIREERPVPPSIARMPRKGLSPASFVQEALWLVHLLDPVSPVYNLPLAWELNGPLEPAALEAAVAEVARRHEVLRAALVDVEGRPFLDIAPAGSILVPRVDLSALPAAAREAEVARVVREAAGGPFDLGRGPLLRARLAVLAPRDHVLVLALHHTVFDGWSQSLLSRELTALYEAAVQDRAPVLPALPVQYADFAVWQRTWLEGPVLTRLLAWWRDELGDAPAAVDLPTDRPRPPVQTFRGRWEFLECAPGLADALLAAGRRAGATPFMLILAAFQVLLHRITQQEDLLVGSPVANRPLPELAPLIGYFVNTVVLRGTFHGEESFSHRLGRVRETVLRAFTHQDLPFPQLAAELQPERDPSQNPLFQVLFALDEEPAPLALSGVRSQPLSLGEPAAKFDLSLGARVSDGGLRLHLEYNLDLFDPATARRLVESFAVLLASIAEDPRRRLDGVCLLSASELQELLAAAERIAALRVAPRRLHDLFTAQAAVVPQEVAVLTPLGEGLTYAELDRRSARLAEALAGRGVGAEVPVGVCLERSPDLLVALLGVLKAGGVYLPLDPAYPPERLALMLKDAGAAIALTCTSLAGRLPSGAWEIVALDAPEGPPADAESESCARVDAALPEGLAYLIYTSGSTGSPKAVGISHALAAAHMEIAAGLFALGRGDRFLQFSSPSFDMAMEETLAPLSRGATVVLRDSELWEPAALLERLAALGVTVVNLPTAYWQQWAQDCETATLPADLRLRLAVVGGEPLSREAARRWLRSPLGGVPLINGYGPTEGIVTATAHAVDAAAAVGGGSVPIGRAIAGRCAWVLDRRGEPVPPGIAGELCLGGPLLARGYLRRPALTAERFVPDPFSGEPGARLYRTGDRARRRPDGVLEFLGRTDRQLKLRGFRVEPGEIESTLARHPAVRTAVVDARPGQGGGPRLVAWIVPAGTAPDPSELTGFLRSALPDPMVPSAFVMLDELPLTPNGKVDLRALQAPDLAGAGDLEPRLAPRTATEERMAALWCELLGRTRIGVHDSLFELGGHSLLAARLLSRVGDAFGVKVPMRALFSAPTIEGLARLVDLLARGEAESGPQWQESRREVVELESPAAEGLSPGRRPERLPLSFAQHRLWLVERLQPAGAAYNIPIALRLTGSLAPAALRWSLGEIVRRHEVLRTRFVEADLEPSQEILPARTPELPLVDLGALPPPAGSRELDRLQRAEARRRFDLGGGPFLRFRLLRLAAAEHVVLLVLHHAISDGWSQDVLLRDLAALYQAACAGRPSPLPELPVQYADFAVWQRRWMSGEVLAEHLAFWREKLAGMPPLDLPTDHPRPAVWTYRGSARSVALPLELGAGLRSLGHREGVTPFMVLLAGVQSLLGRYSDQDDFAVGSPAANRTRSETENLIGFFVNMVVLRADLSGAPGFLELLSRVRGSVLEAFAHQELPFERLVEAIAPERDLGWHPLFQVTFQAPLPAAPPAFPGLSVEAAEVDTETAKFDLALQIVDGGDGPLAATCEYATDLFEGTTIRRLLAHLGTLLQSAFETPGRSVADLPSLDAAERHQLLQAWNDTPVESCLGIDGVHRLVEGWARRTPEAPAVVSWGESISYRELDRRADCLARRLRRLGAGLETLVGVSLERSPELVVTLLAVLKSGAAYLPLDPSLPRERLAWMRSDAGATLVIGPRDLAAAWEASGSPCVWLDAADEDPDPADGIELPPASGADTLAYVIYTSGSTGRPKGVEVGHRSLLNLVAWHQRAFAVTAADRATQLAQVGFDASVWEIWSCLAAGACLHLADDEVRTSPELLRDWLAERRVTISFVPTPLAEGLLDLEWPADTSLRAMLTGGDRLRQAPGPRLPFVLHNNYGPTEGTVVSTSCPLAPRAGEGAAPPIGRPIDGVRIQVLDSSLRPVPVGVAGELYVGGASLARGYRNRPDLMAERFLPCASAETPGERLYRTGDRVRLRPDGELDFLGRADHQVKVRGFRIEPGEIEAVLLEHPQVREAVVVAREDSAGEARLVAYAVPTDPSAPGGELDLRGWLAGKLPAYMVPSAFVALAALPLTATGKVDRRALPAPTLAGGVAAAPRDAIEEMIAGIWIDVLGLESAGVHDDFFALGGHSLRATQLAARLRQAFALDLPLKAVFEAHTIALLAERVKGALRGTRGFLLPPVTRGERPERIPLSFAQQRLWFIDRLEPGQAVYNIASAFSLDGPLDVAALAGSLAEVVRRHDILRACILEEAGQPWQEIGEASAFVLPLVDLAALPPECRRTERDRLALAEERRPFDLARGPLFRRALVRLAENEHALFFTLHHIITDAWSEDLLRRETSALYAAALAGRPSPLPELPVQYTDYALWQRRWPARLLDSQLDYWRAQLDGLATLELPTDHPRPSVQSFRGALEPLRIPRQLGMTLHELGRRRGVTLFMTCLAGWQALLARLSEQSDIPVGAAIANRNRPELEGLIGFFLNMLVYRGDLRGDPTFAELLARIRHTALEAYENRDVPFERLIDELRARRDLSRQPLAQVMIALQDGGDDSLALPGIRATLLSTEAALAKFDLTLYLETDGRAVTGSIEYCSDLFDRTTILRLRAYLLNLFAAVTVEPEVRLSEIGLLTAAERQQLLEEWNDTRAPFPDRVLLHQFFAAQADRQPTALAAVWRGDRVTYSALEARANRIANLLRESGLERGAPVGVWMERSFDMLASVLGILKAGGYYLPLDPAWPPERVETILGTSEAPAILTRSAHLGPVLAMRWRLPALADVVCLDAESPAPPAEPLDAEGIRSLFDLIAERAVDRVTAGGFISGFTGAPFSEAEVDEYRDRVLALAEPWLGTAKRVLEIGCGSGLLLWEMAPRAARCVGLDPSPRTQERNRARAEALGLGHVELPVGFADEIEGWPEGSFDLILLASTVQFFPGPLYLERVVAQALRLLAPGGALLIADVPDARRQQALRQAIEEHRARTGGEAAVRAEPAGIRSFDEDLFRDFAALPGAGKVSVLHRERGFDNELRFRFDVLLTADAERGEAGERPRRKRLWTSWHVERRAADRPPVVASPEDLAYVIYTSGSTGQPKGIAVQHRPVANLIAWLNDALAIGPADRVLFVTSLCFDLSVWDIFGVLAAGGCVHVASEEDLRDPERLVRMLVDEPITVWDSAPAALVRLAPLFPSEPSARSRLRRVMLSGDWIPVTLPDRVRAAFPGAEVTSLGGATEATIWSNCYPVGSVDPQWPSIPYGRPILNSRYHVLDAGLAPCPVGVPGDLYIGGDVLCVGYAQQPAVTAAAFLPDPFAGERGARIYRTGDRARYYADGNLEFLGRIDHQVKIRGFRIELGEIEAALARHPGVREAVVLARQDVAGDKRLVAYVVPPRAGKGTPAAELRSFLRRTLPDYMIPSAFVELAALPVTPNGKLDRRALPAPVREAAGEETAELPRTPTEEVLIRLWREVLRVERVGISDNFFELGGHSLLATQLVARLRETFGGGVPLRYIFLAPTLAELAAALDAACAETGGSAETSPIRPVPRTGELPLSASQLRQWFLVQLEPESTDYNIPLAFRLAGELRPEALGTALREIVRRHEALRTTFAAVAGRPAAVISPVAVLPLPVLDLAGLPAQARDGEARRLIAEEHDRPFDLTRGPVLRTLLIRLTAAEHLFAATVHHIAFDGSSLGVFLRELAALYEAFAAGRPSPLSELPIQYVDYAAWQREWLASSALDAQLSYWKERLAGASQLLELPTDRPRPAMQSGRGALLPLSVPAGLADSLRTLARREGATLFMVLLAGYATLLSRYTGQEDLNIGTYVANRRWEVLERLIGFFVNTLVLRAELAGRPSFRDLLFRTRETALDAFEHQETPIERLLEELDIERDLSRSPLFQVMFGVQNFDMPSLEVSGLSIRPIEVTEHGRINSDLAFWMWEEEQGLTGWLQFSTDLFDGPTIERMFGYTATLLAAAAAAPDLRLSELPLLSEDERRQVLREWSVGGSPRGPVPLVHERVRRQARRTPEAPAVLAGGQRLTYGELGRRAGRVACGLRRLGIGPESVVGLCIDRSPEMVVALFGILGAGAAYLPLDPALPAERLRLLAGDAGVQVILTRDALVRSLPALPGRILRVDADFDGESGEGLPAGTAAPESAAYILYTSGSTGVPKGVIVEHRALAAFVEAALSTYGFGAEDRVLQFANLAFDTSVEEIYTCLSAGGTLVLREEEMMASPARFFAACREAGVTVLDLPTAWWHEMSVWVEGATPPLPPALRLVILGGERALPERVRAWLAATGPRPRLVNSYGPTEGTVVATTCDLAAAAPAVPVGRPLPGVEVYLLDRNLELMPAGVLGEICLGGAGLARGYLGRPDLTAERFIPSPFGSPGERLYRTGDLGRWRPDGQLDFAGRVDDQVKIRGFRIEPGEVAAALARHPAVQEAVAVAHEVRPGERELTAYAVPAGEPRPEVGELRAFLKQRLPAYMVPSGLMLLASLPRTPTNKVDRKALPAPGEAVRRGGMNGTPETPTEELLAEIWQQVLEVERVGTYDNFFDLGGHSLLAPQVIARIEETFQVALPLRVLFESSTVAQMAIAVEQILLAQIEELSEEEVADLVGEDY